MLRFVICCFLFCCALLFCLLSHCWFCFVIVSPRLRYGAFIVLFLTTCVINSSTPNKDLNFTQSPLFVCDCSEKSDGNPGLSWSIAISPPEGQLPTDPAQLKVVRHQRKGGITRHLGTLEQLMAEERYDDFLKRLDIMKQSFSQLEAAHEA